MVGSESSPTHSFSSAARIVNERFDLKRPQNDLQIYLHTPSYLTRAKGWSHAHDAAAANPEHTNELLFYFSVKKIHGGRLEDNFKLLPSELEWPVYQPLQSKQNWSTMSLEPGKRLEISILHHADLCQTCVPHQRDNLKKDRDGGQGLEKSPGSVGPHKITEEENETRAAQREQKF